MSETYLVTGCAGFIAACVSTALLGRGDRVVGVDDLNASYDPRLKEWRLAQLKRHPRFEFFPLDLADTDQASRFFSLLEERQTAAGSTMEAVLHLAARAGVRASVENPTLYFRVNLLGTVHVLEGCSRLGIRKFVLSSTSSAYGEGCPVPFREDAHVGRPVSPYAVSKLAAEMQCHVAHHMTGLDVSVLRYFTVYGPAGRPDMSVFRFIRKIANREPIVIYGDGTQQRDFTFVDDIAKGTIAAIRPLGYEVINLGNDSPVPLLHVVETIGKLLGHPPRIEFRPSHPADVKQTWANIDKAQRQLHWSPGVTLDEGLARCVSWYYEQREFVDSLLLGE